MDRRVGGVPGANVRSLVGVSRIGSGNAVWVVHAITNQRKQEFATHMDV